MSTFNMHEIKRQARKEAWYGDSYNPFRMTGRAKTWKPDLEPGYTDTRQSGILGDHFREDETPLSAVQCTPAVHTTDDPGKGDEQQSTPPRSEQTTCHRFLAQYNITKTVEVKSNKQTQVASTTDTSWELDTEKLSWDPFGCLSEKLSEPSYLHSTLRVLQSERMLKMESTQQLPARDVNFKGAGAPMTSIQNTKPQNIDVHLLTVTATTVQPVELFYDASDLLNTATTKPTQDPSGRLFVVEDVSPSLIEAFHNAFGCSMEVFSDHLRRAGEDVALVLPSISRRQPHVVIPYRRTYQPSSRKEIRESRNLRSSFSHGGLVTTEEHVTCWLSPTIDGSWTG
ncbi:hypothetical protein BKA61DRAFT_302200 [Leptodontidium sp. MPI-SDFR-AT-0119]|nr:hypothetical protein BKA61DRAFT_302200 [Leptodontidium sp. MPI-SDFR-AT-0119]